MSNSRIIVLGGVSVGVWWLLFTCKGRAFLDASLARLGPQGVKLAAAIPIRRPAVPCCAGCAGAEPSAVGAASSLPSLPSPPPPAVGFVSFAPEPSGAVPELPSIGLPGFVREPSGTPYAPAMSMASPYAPATSAYALPAPPPPPLDCVEPACRPYVAPVVAAPVPVPLGADLKPPITEPYVRPVSYDGITGTVGPLTAVLTALRTATAPSYLAPAPAPTYDLAALSTLNYQVTR